MVDRGSARDERRSRHDRQHAGTIIATGIGEVRVFAQNSDGSVMDTLNVTVTNAAAVVTMNRTRDTLTAPTHASIHG